MDAHGGLPLSPTRRVGDMLFLSGQIAVEHGAIVGDDVATQTNKIMNMAAELLKGHGLALADVVKTTVWLTRQTDFAAFNVAYSARFQSPYPARSTVVSQLAMPGALIEIEMIAAF